jgi:hypothetical protein
MKEILITEYNQLKSEQQRRIATRDNLLYSMLAAIAAIVAATVTTRGHVYLLLVPPVVLTLGWVYLNNDHKISLIGDYVYTTLAPQLATLTAADPRMVFGWERVHRACPGRTARRRTQVAVDAVALCIAPTLAVITYWATTPSIPAPLLLASIADLAPMAALAYHIALYAGLGPKTWE